MGKKRAVLLVNLGTPEQPSRQYVREFLRDFLSDKRVVDTARFIWLPILYLIILPIRSVKVAKLYQAIWHNGDSPLRFYTQSQATKLAQKLAPHNISVKYAMTYGKPSIAEQLKKFNEQGIDQLTVLPLYPQYSVSTTAPVFDQLSAAIKILFMVFLNAMSPWEMYISSIVSEQLHWWLMHYHYKLVNINFVINLVLDVKSG